MGKIENDNNFFDSFNWNYIYISCLIFLNLLLLLLTNINIVQILFINYFFVIFIWEVEKITILISIFLFTLLLILILFNYFSYSKELEMWSGEVSVWIFYLMSIYLLRQIFDTLVNNNDIETCSGDVITVPSYLLHPTPPKQNLIQPPIKMRRIDDIKPKQQAYKKKI